jgi:hypothetical protein
VVRAAGDAEPSATDGIYHPTKDILVRKDASFLAGFGRSLYGNPSPEGSASRGASRRNDAGSGDAAAERLRRELLRTPFPASVIGTPAEFPVAIPSDLTRGAARRLAATLALSGRAARSPTSAGDGGLPDDLDARIDPPVPSIAVDAFPKARTPRVIVRRNGRDGNYPATLAVFGEDGTTQLRLPLRALGLASTPHVLYDLSSG